MRQQYSILVLVLLAFMTSGLAQKSPATLRRELDQASKPIEQIELIIELGKHYNEIHFDSAFYFFSKGYDLAQKQIKINQNKKDQDDLFHLMAVTLRNLTYLHNIFGDNEGVRKYAGKLIAMGEERADTVSLIVAWLSLGNTNHLEGNFSDAKEDYLRAFHLAEALNDSLHIAKLAQNLGIIHFYMGNLDEAATYTHNALEYYSLQKNLLGESSCLLTLGNLMYDQEDFGKALNYYNEAYLGFEELNHIEGKYNSILNIGALMLIEKRYSEAIQRFEQALEMAREINDNQGIVKCLHNIGMSNSQMGNPAKALQYYQEALIISRANRFKHLEASTLSNLSAVNNDLGKFNEALNLASRSLELSREIQLLDDQMYAYKNLSIAQEGLGNLRQALDYHKIFKHLNDSLTRIQTRREIMEAETKYQTARIRQEMELKNALLEKQDLELAQQSINLSRQKIIRNFMIFSIFILSLIMLHIFNNSRQRKKTNALILEQNEEISLQHEKITQQKNIIEEKNQALVSSIMYAQNIQNALLPDDTNLQASFEDFFIIYEPKGIVSGDFYWFNRQNDTTLLALADSTGHGVPGAFLSIMGMSFLNEFMARRKYYSTAQLLDDMRLHIISSLHQKEDQNVSKDGIEMALLSIDHKRYTINYSGAKTPIYVAPTGNVQLNGDPLPNEGKPLFKIKGDSMPLSFHRKMKTFSNHILNLSPGDRIYIMTDGFADQFGSETGERFTNQRIMELLGKISELSMAKQKEILLSTLHDWKRGYDQIDDIAMIGFKV